MENQEIVLENEKNVSSQKSFTVTGLLCFYLGALGVHRFYVGKIWTGILQIFLFLMGAIGIILSKHLLIAIIIFRRALPFFYLCALAVIVWFVIDFILILCGIFTDKNGLPLKLKDKIQTEEFITLFFSVFSIEFVVIGLLSLYLNNPSIFKVFEWTSIILAVIPFLYGFIGVVIKNERNAKLFGFISSISIFLTSSFILICHVQ